MESFPPFKTNEEIEQAKSAAEEAERAQDSLKDTNEKRTALETLRELESNRDNEKKGAKDVASNKEISSVSREPELRFSGRGLSSTFPGR